MHQHATIGDTVYFWFAANDTSGSGGDGATPLYDVRKAGAAASAIPLLSGTPTLLTHANYPAGCHEVSVAATVGNGFAADDTFAVFCTLAIDTQNPTGFVGSCTLTPLAKASALVTAQTDLDTITGSDGVTLATTQPNYAPNTVVPDAAGVAAQASVCTEARLSELDAGTGGKAANQIDLIKTEADKIAELTTQGDTNETHLTDIKGATFSSATDSLEAVRDRGDSAWITGAGGSDRLLMVDTTIATLASQTSFTLNSGSADDNAYNNCTIVIEDVTTSTQKAVALISDYIGLTKTVTLKYDPAIFTMAATDKVYILAENSLKTTAANRQLDVTATGAAGIDWGNVENKGAINDLSATDINLVDTCTANTDMAGTNGAALASVCTEARLSELDAGTGGKAANQIDLIKTEADKIALADAGAGVAGSVIEEVENRATVTALSTAQTDLDTITGSDGVTLATTQLNYAPNTVVPDAAGVAPTAVEVRQEMDSNSVELAKVAGVKTVTDEQGKLVISGSAVTGTLLVGEMTTDLTVSVADQYNGRILTFTDTTTTVNLRGQQTNITATTVSGSKLGFTALTNAPVNGDTFSIT